MNERGTPCTDHDDVSRSARAFDLSAPPDDYFADPSAYFRMLRTHDPMHDNGDGSLLLTRYGDVRAVWRDLTATVDKYDRFKIRFGEGPLLEYHGTNMLFSDPPRHDRLRRFLNPFFSPRRLQGLAVEIDAIVDRLVDQLAEKGEVDFANGFALQLPTEVICLILGIPAEDGNALHAISEKVVNPLNPNLPEEEILEGHAATVAFRDYLLEHLKRLRVSGRFEGDESVLAALAAAERDGDEISEDEILHTAMLVFIGGHSTTTNMLAKSLHWLLGFPDQLLDLRRNPEILDRAIEELIRFVSPTQLQGRRTTREIRIPSGWLASGSEIILCPGSANRDETVFADPDRLNLRRDPNDHIAFGAGVHFCIGRPLVRLEMRSALTRILSRFESIERTGEARFRPLPRFRAMERLPLRFR